MNDWIDLKSEEELRKIVERSVEKAQVIFKDSTTCGISAHAKERLREGFGQIAGKADFYYLDLLKFRNVSNHVARELGVTHQSPQIIVLKNGRVAYDVSHHAINVLEIARHL